MKIPKYIKFPSARLKGCIILIMENSRIRHTPTPENEHKHEQDCECVRCIDIEINQFNPNKTSRRLPRIPKRLPRPINNRQKERDEICNNNINGIYNINIKLEQKELNQLPTYKDYFYKKIEEEMDDYQYQSQLKELKQEIKNLQDWVIDYQQIGDIKKDINKLKNDMKELQEFSNIIIQNEINDQAKQSQINRLNGKTKKIEQLLNEQTKELKQREQIKKLKED